MPPAGSLEDRDVYSSRPENPRRSVLRHFAVLPQRLRRRRRRHRCRVDGRISRPIGTRDFIASHWAIPRCVRRSCRDHRHSDSRLFGGRRLRAAIRVLEIVVAPGHVGESLSRGGRSRGRRHRDGHSRETVFAAVVLRGRRRCRLASALGHVHLGRARRHVVVHAVGQQRVVPPMMMRLSAPLRLVLLGLRAVRGRFLRLLPARRFLRSRRRRGRRGWCLGRAPGPRSLRGNCTVFAELVLQDPLVGRARADFRCCCGLRGCAGDTFRVASLVVFLMVATRVTSLRLVVVRPVGAARLFRVGEPLLVRDGLRSLLHQVSANFLRRDNVGISNVQWKNKTDVSRLSELKETGTTGDFRSLSTIPVALASSVSPARSPASKSATRWDRDTRRRCN